MAEIPQKAVALFTNKAYATYSDTENQQMILRSCAAASNLLIVAFVAMPKASPERLIQALELCKNYEAQTIMLDAMDTLFMPTEALISFIASLIEKKISLIDASTRAFFLASQLLSLEALLRTSIWAVKEMRGKNIKKALRLKKRIGEKLGAKKYGQSPEELAVIKHIIELYDAGLSLQKICTILSSTDIPSVRHKKWHPTTIKRIIEREKAM